MTRPLQRKGQRCYLVFGYAPDETSMSDANTQFNAYVGNKSRGLVLFHDHFVDKVGGVAIFYIENDDEWELIHSAEELSGWDIQIHPFIYADNPKRFFYQIDFTMSVYRGIRMNDLLVEYEKSDEKQSLDARD